MLKKLIISIMLFACAVFFPAKSPENVKAQQNEKQDYSMTPDELEDESYYDSLEMLAMCVEAEAGNQSLLGKRMVVDVILNRVDDEGEDWPDTIEGVISQPYQFSTYWDGSMEEVYEPSEETILAVQMELEERSYPGIFYFTAEGFAEYGTPWKKVEDHYFSTR